MAEGLYRIGECIYMEVYPPPTPYHICKIEELRKNAKGSVEVAAKCFYRRKDLPQNLLIAADRHTLAVEEENEMDVSIPRNNNYDKMTPLQKHQIRHRELFLSRQIETYKIDMVRGKCAVSLLNELEDIRSYMEKEDTFFYTMVYDPNQKTLLVDKGEIRIGLDYQAEVPQYSPPPSDYYKDYKVDSQKVWEPFKMPDQKVEQFLVVARSIGTFARALLDGAKKPQISLRLGAAAASRDITLFHAMDTLNQNCYDVSVATSKLVPRGPVLCADELEAWSQEEARRFEEGLQDQKDFLYIQRSYLPWKSLKSIVSYYYMWKTTDRYQIQKRHRMIEKQNDLKEVIVHLRTPSGAPPAGPRDLSGKAASAGDLLSSIPEDSGKVPIAPDGEKGCEGCLSISASRWVPWGPAHEHCRLCNHCYVYWRKYGGLKLPTKWEMNDKRSAASNIVCPPILRKNLRGDRPPERSSKKGKFYEDRHDLVPPLPFYMRPSGVILVMRRKMGTAMLLRASRNPFIRINTQGLPKPSAAEIKQVMVKQKRVYRRQRNPEVGLAQIQHVLSSPPKQFKLQTSPMPISPSYRAKGKTGLFSLPKDATPVKPHPLVGQQQIASTGIFVPPVVGTPSSRKRDAPPPDLTECPPAKVPRSDTQILPGELFFKANRSIKDAREDIGRRELLKLARSPMKS